MRYHESDRGKRASELWRDACCLHHLLQINLERYPKGNVIRKQSVQKRVLRDGKEKTYTYYYENVDVWGEGQYHLPVSGNGGRRNGCGICAARCFTGRR